MSQLTITVGLPGSGKTTWADRMVRDARRPTFRLSRDDVRERFGFPAYGTPEQEQLVTTVADIVTLALLRARVDVIRDDTHLRPGFIDHQRRLATSAGAGFAIEDFTSVSLDVCIARDRKRTHPVGEDAIRGLWAPWCAEGIHRY